MNYHWCHCADTRNNILVTHRMVGGRLSVAAEYKDIACPKCLKVDEDAAIGRGIVPFEFRTSFDYVASSDGFLCVSTRVKQAIEQSHFVGLEFHKVTTKGGVVIYLAVCNIFVSANEAEFRFEDRCSSCGRWGWTGKLPSQSAVSLPGRPTEIFQLDVPIESGFGRNSLPFASDLFVRFMRNENFTGFGGVMLQK